MFVPLHDANPLQHIRLQFVTLGLIGVTCLVYFVVQAGGVTDANIATVASFGLIPSAFNDQAARAAEIALVPEMATLVTYAFFHADIWHLIGNMLFLWVFGDNVEDAVGHWRFLAFYLLCAVGGGLAHAWMMPDSALPLIGASGAVAGIIGAYLILHPHVKVWVLALGRIPLRLPALWVLGFWVLVQIVEVVAMDESEVSWWAHLGGLATGAVLIVVLRRPGVKLFDRDLKTV